MGKKRRRAEATADPDAGLDGGDFSLAGGAPGLDDLGTGLWFDDAAAALAPAEPEEAAAADAGRVEQARGAAQAAHDAAVAAHEASKAGAKDSSDSKWMQTVLRSGTTSDKVAAMTLLVQESPMHNMASLQKLLDLAAKKGGAREGRTMACDALKDLLLQNLLPERKLRWFAQQPLGALPEPAGPREERLRYWHFEDALKRSYIDFLAILERDLGDTVSKFKLKAMHTVADLLRAKPENEQILLTLLANKIGDTDKRVGSRAVHLMQTLVFEHSAMKAVVAREVENVAFRSNVGLRTQYYAVIFLSNLTLLRGTDDALAAQLIGTYFGLFEQMVRGASAGDKESDASVQSRLMSALLTGVNRAFPFAREQMDSETTERHVEALYRLVHTRDSVTGGMQINVSIQALLLLQQIGAVGSELSDRFYRSLYSLLLMPELRSCRKQAMLLNLIYKAMAKDAAEERLKAFVKRLLQICSYHHPPFICGTLFLLSELAKAKPTLRKWIASAPESDLSAQRGDADEEAETDSGAESAAPKKKKKSRGAKGGDDDIQINQRKRQAAPEPKAEEVEEAAAAGGGGEAGSKYDAKKREPLHAGAGSSLPWELVGLRRHFHPTVQSFSANLSAGTTIEYGGDPLVDHTLMAFLDRFMFKKPKAPKKQQAANAYSAHAARGRLAERGVSRNIGKGLGVVNSAAFAQLPQEAVPSKDMFFHHFFSRAAVQRNAEARRKARDAKAAAKAEAAASEQPAVRGFGDDSSDDDSEDEAPPAHSLDDMSIEPDGAESDDFDFDDSEDDDDSEDEAPAAGGFGSTAFADADDFAALIADEGGASVAPREHKKQVAWEEERTEDRSHASRKGRKGAGARKKKRR